MFVFWSAVIPAHEAHIVLRLLRSERDEVIAKRLDLPLRSS